MIHLIVDPASNMGSALAAAVVTDVYDEGKAIAARVFHKVTGSTSIDAVDNVPFHASLADAKAALDKIVQDYYTLHGGVMPDLKHVHFAFWPDDAAADQPPPVPAVPDLPPPLAGFPPEPPAPAPAVPPAVPVPDVPLAVRTPDPDGFPPPEPAAAALQDPEQQAAA
jgi:hypothetical protein